MLPDAIELVPKILQENINNDGQALVDKLDEYIGDWKEETNLMQNSNNPVLCPQSMLEELGYQISANLLNTDTDRQKRVKILNAVKGHKKRSSFNLDAKIKIDAIAGGNSKIIRGITSDDWILCGDVIVPTSYYWATMGCDGIDDDYGLSLIGDGYEIELSGNVYIDVDNDSLTTSQIAQIRLELENDVAPAYMRIFIGYVNISGVFIIYDIIE